MEHDDGGLETGPPPGPTAGIDRRHLLALGAAAWVAPTILSTQAAAAQSQPPAPCSCGDFAPPILITVVLGPCIPSPVAVTLTPTQSAPQTVNLGASSSPGLMNFFGFCDGESVTVTLTGAACTTLTPTIDVFCQQPNSQVIFTCQGCAPPPL